MTKLSDLNPDFRDLLIAFGAEGVDFVIVGAYALAFHGAPRFTGDLDVLVRPEAENARRIWRALLRFGAPVQAAGVVAEDFTTEGIVYQIGLPPRRIDVLTQITGVTFDEAWASRETVDLEGTPVHFLGKEALLRNKGAVGRPKDLADIARLKR